MGSIKYALKVIEGKLRGHLYYLPENSELFLGRGASFDIVIDEDMVSRRHAKILTFHDQVTLQDLNSTNGTSVNQKLIQGAQRLQVGDLLTVGTCILELTHVPPGMNPNNQFDHMGAQVNSSMAGSAIGSTVGSNSTMDSAFGQSNSSYMDALHTPAPHNNSYQPNTLPQPPQSGGGFSGFNARPSQPARIAPPVSAGGAPFNNMVSINGARPRMKPEVGAFPSPDMPDVLSLLERLVERRHDGVLAVFDPEEREGSIYLRGGRVYFSTYEDPHRVLDIPMSPQQSLIKICCWTQGRYKVKSVNALPTFEQEMNEDSRSLLEHVRHSCHEMNQLRSQLPPLNTRLSVSQPLNSLLTSLSADQLYLFQLALNQYEVRSMIDCHPQGEREGIKALLHLLEHGYLQP